MRDLENGPGDLLFSPGKELSPLEAEGTSPLLAYLPLIKKVPLFKIFNETQLVTFLGNFDLFDLPSGHQIIKKGDQGDSFFLILEGNAEVAYDENSQSRPSLLPGDIFGEMALITGLPRTADVISKSRILLAKLKKETFDTLCGDFPAAADLLTELLITRLEEQAQAATENAVGNYLLQQILGKGGMGVVYQAKNQLTGMTYALKMLPHQMVFHKKQVDSFLAEAALVKEMKHPNIILLHEIIFEYGTYFMVLELLKGRTLHEKIQSLTALPISEVISLISGILKALNYARGKGVIHKDIKPANIMWNEEGEVKLLDFGAAYSKRGELTEGEEKVIGSLGYMSPEQAQGQKLTWKSDLYALGVVAFQCLTGHLPYKGRNLLSIVIRQMNDPVPRVKEVRGEVPFWLDQFIFKCLQPQAEKRPDSVIEYIELFEQIKEKKLDIQGRRVLKEGGLSGVMVPEQFKNLMKHPEDKTFSGELWKIIWAYWPILIGLGLGFLFAILKVMKFIG